jgi:hypothetical protein
VHSSPKHEFTSFYFANVSEMLQNTPNNHLGSNGVEWMLRLRNHICNFGTPNSALRPETQVLRLLLCWRLVKCSETPPNIILGPMEYNECIATSIPINSAFRPETQISHHFPFRRFAKCSKNVPIIISGALHLFSFWRFPTCSKTLSMILGPLE